MEFVLVQVFSIFYFFKKFSVFDSGLLDVIEEAAPAPGSALLCHTYISIRVLLETVEVARCLFTFSSPQDISFMFS